MRKPPHNRRTDAQIRDTLLKTLELSPGTRSGLEQRINSGRDIVLRALGMLIEEGLVETYRATVSGQTYDFYCLAGRAPKPKRTPGFSAWANTLAAFREAVYGAVREGRDPFKVAA
jgi:hypothetical protein